RKTEIKTIHQHVETRSNGHNNRKQTVSSAPAMNIARTGMTAPFMVILTDILSRGIPSNSRFISSIESTATPAIPTSPYTRGLSESYPL
uniref:Uncharacterized protein n=1 Tax=Parascaris univalens TaxID=6257 RepID=A0A915ALA5_PARUN